MSSQTAESQLTENQITENRRVESQPRAHEHAKSPSISAISQVARHIVQEVGRITEDINHRQKRSTRFLREDQYGALQFVFGGKNVTLNVLLMLGDADHPGTKVIEFLRPMVKSKRQQRRQKKAKPQPGAEALLFEDSLQAEISAVLGPGLERGLVPVRHQEVELYQGQVLVASADLAQAKIHRHWNTLTFVECFPIEQIVMHG